MQNDVEVGTWHDPASAAMKRLQHQDARHQDVSRTLPPGLPLRLTPSRSHVTDIWACSKSLSPSAFSD